MYTLENLGTSDTQWDGEQWIVTHEVGEIDDAAYLNTVDRSQLDRAWFTGPNAEQLAREYAAWKNGQAG